MSLGKNNIPVPIPTSLKVPVEKGTRNLVVTRAFEAGPGRLGQLQNLTETGASHVGEVEPVASDHVRNCHLQVSIVSGRKQANFGAGYSPRQRLAGLNDASSCRGG